jgi:hypothetical protein
MVWQERLMMGWLKRPGPIQRDRFAAHTETASPFRFAAAGQYKALYKYLDERYANTVVLTFAEIEDLLGFSLPDLARLQQEWWTSADSAPATHSCSWTLARRTAKANLSAQTVVFERVIA